MQYGEFHSNVSFLTVCYFFQSDIGAPLVYKNQLIGLYIGGDTCNYHGVPDLYTDVSALRQWIEDTIKKNSNEEEMEGLFSATNGDVSS